MNVRRALLAALLYGIIVGVLTTNVVPALLTALDVSNPGSSVAIGTTIIPTSRMLITIIAAFIAGWWGASGLASRSVRQGLLIGAFVVLVGLGLAAAGDGITAWTGTLLLDAAAAVGGAVVAGTALRIRRAVVAAALQVIARFAFVFVALIVFGFSVTDARGKVSESEAALFQRYMPWLALVAGIGTAFLAGWWGTRGLRDDAVRQGLLIGTLIFAFSLLSIAVLGGEPNPESVVLNSLEIGAAILGAMFAQRRTGAQPA